MDFREQIRDLLVPLIEEFSTEEIQNLIEVPPNSEMGDFAFPCFKLAKNYRKAPPLIAAELAGKIEKPDFLSEIKGVGGYLNFFIDRTLTASKVIRSAIEKRDDFGRMEIGKGKNIIVEFSSPNIAKPFHIGHIRTTVIGHSLYRIYRFLGYPTTAINHLGDYGTQFGKLIVAYKAWGDEAEVKADPIPALLKLYVRFHDEAQNHPEMEDQAREWFHKLEEGDEEAYKLWSFFREVSLEEFSRVYDMLGIRFDSFAGESFYSDKMPEVIEILEAKKLLQESRGAQIVDLEPYGMPPSLIKKSDGSTLYITRDLAAAIYRSRTYDFYKNIYVVGSQQALHFKQWIQILDMMGFEAAKGCVHVQFGMVSLEDGTLSTRKGRVVFLEDVLNQAIRKTKEVILQKNPNLPNIDELSKQIGVGAVVFQELSNSRIKDYTFSWERTLSFEGETGPYVQYTHARACSLIRKAGMKIDANIDYRFIADNKDAMEVVRVLGTFEEVIRRAADRYEPHHVTRFVLDLAQAFNKFYHDNPILSAEEEEKKARLALVEATRIGVKNALDLLGMQAPEQM
ncbi:MAG: arginine--tRNA ligase [Peptostreptococcaceae bacterium]|nr:arginine--tRNA ligase [Peptostreptococcaceae bacterium]